MGYPRKTHSRLYVLAFVIFASGAIGGALIYLFNGVDPEGAFQLIDSSNSKAYDDQLERIGGRSVVFADQFNRWMGSLWHGQQLGVTIFVITTVFALILLWVARQMELDDLYRTTQDKE